MLRFRFREDEKRYLKLLGEVYRLVASHLPPQHTSTALRNLGKIQDMLMLEGVRQGVAAAAISNLAKNIGDGDLEHLKAFQLHAHIYGSSDTPLSAAEAEWIEKLGFRGPGFERACGPWLDPESMRFAPATEEELAPETALEAMREFRALDDGSPLAPRADEPIETAPERAPATDDVEIGRLLTEATDAQERPDLLDRVRDALIGLKRDGFEPTGWSDMLMKLHLTMHVDAGFLDLQLSTPMGMTVLSQAGYTHLHPGAQIDLMSLQGEVEALPATTPEPSAEGESGSAGDSDGTSPSDTAP